MPSNRESSLNPKPRLLYLLHLQAGSLLLVPPGKPDQRLKFCHMATPSLKSNLGIYSNLNKGRQVAEEWQSGMAVGLIFYTHL